MTELKEVNDRLDVIVAAFKDEHDRQQGTPDAAEKIGRELDRLVRSREKLALYVLLRRAMLGDLSEALRDTAAELGSSIDPELASRLAALEAVVEALIADRAKPTHTPQKAPLPKQPDSSQPKPDISKFNTYPLEFNSDGDHAGRDVCALQEFLNGMKDELGLQEKLGIDGVFGQNTLNAVNAFQRLVNIPVSRSFELQSIAAAVVRGFEPILFPKDDEFYRSSWPQNSPNLKQPRADRTIAMLGDGAAFKFETAGKRRGKIYIRYLDGYDTKYLVTLPIDGLEKLPADFSNKIRVHKLVADQFVNMFDDWRRAGLVDRLINYEGSHSARYKSTVTTATGKYDDLSNHSWGTAIDLNTTWNFYGDHPARMADRGCIRELVQIANENGFYWGGRFGTPDGMHFEAAQIVKRERPKHPEPERIPERRRPKPQEDREDDQLAWSNAVFEAYLDHGKWRDDADDNAEHEAIPTELVRKLVTNYNANKDDRRAQDELGLLSLVLATAEWGISDPHGLPPDPAKKNWRSDAAKNSGKHAMGYSVGGVGSFDADQDDLLKLLHDVGESKIVPPEYKQSFLRLTKVDYKSVYNEIRAAGVCSQTKFHNDLYGEPFKHFDVRPNGSYCQKYANDALSADDWLNFRTHIRAALRTKHFQRWLVERWLEKYWRPSLKKIVEGPGRAEEALVNARIRNSGPGVADKAIAPAGNELVDRIRHELDSYERYYHDRYVRRCGIMQRPVVLFRHFAGEPPLPEIPCP